MITFRLADALPASALARINDELRGQPEGRRRQRLEAYLDAGHGACHLRHERIAELVEATLIHDDAKLYRLLAWVIMPNHVHALIETLPGHTAANIVQAWKSVSAKAANQLLDQTGRFWQPEYYDRAIRDERHFAAAVRYIHENPVKAGLVTRVEDWAFSNVSRRRVGVRAGEAPALPG